MLCVVPAVPIFLLVIARIWRWVIDKTPKDYIGLILRMQQKLPNFTITDERIQQIKRAVLERACIIQNDKWCWFELCRYYNIRTVALLEALVGRELSTLPEAIEGLREYQEMLEIRGLPNR